MQMTIMSTIWSSWTGSRQLGLLPHSARSVAFSWYDDFNEVLLCVTVIHYVDWIINFDLVHTSAVCSRV